MYKVEYLPPAITDILETEAYLNEYSQAAADRFTEAIVQKTAALVEHPRMYPAYEDAPYFRRMILENHLLFYSVDEKRQLIVVHRVLHAKRDISRIMSEERKP
jgi:plasmid stabilization system protein ParE